MKKTLLFTTLFAVFASSAFASAGNEDYSQLKKMLNGKSLRCTPSIAPGSVQDGNPKPSKNLKGEGDDGYFTISMKRKKTPLITENGKGMGYGFSSGEVREMAVSGSKIFLSVGDDGWQTLAMDFDDIGSTSELPNNCADAGLIDYSSGRFLGCSFRLTCCLK